MKDYDLKIKMKGNNSISTKLSRDVCMSAKIRHVKKDALCSIYFGIFSSILTIVAKFWDKTEATKTLNFSSFRDLVAPIYKASKMVIQ